MDEKLYLKPSTIICGNDWVSKSAANFAGWATFICAFGEVVDQQGFTLFLVLKILVDISDPEVNSIIKKSIG